MFLGCASKIKKVKVEQPAVDQQVVNYKGVKRRIAIAKFEDKSGYGKNLFGVIDDIGTQSSDILASHLIKTGEFIILERENIDALNKENALQNESAAYMNANALIFGSVTEFGTKTEYEDHGLSKSKVQTAHAKVTVRLVDPKTGVAFYSEFGEARAQKEVSQVLGFGSSAGYDATLTDKALNGSIVKLVGNILSNLRNRPWTTSVLDVQEGNVFIGAGKKSGLTIGDILIVKAPGKRIKNKKTGAYIELPGKEVGTIKVISQFGDTDVNEGSICSIIFNTGIKAEHNVELANN